MSDPLEQLDYYTLLQVEPGAPVDAIKAAFHRFAAKYHPDRFLGGGAPADKVERAAEIYRRGAEGYKVLCDPARRRAYDTGLAQGQVRYDPEAPAAMPPQPALGQWPISVKNPMARPFATKAEQAFKGGDYGNAKMNLKLVLARDPGNAQAGLVLEETERRLSQAAAAKGSGHNG